MAIGMSKHTDSSFNEADANRILAGVLESSHKIKTFFKENDKTPNYDGTFELVSKTGEPKKQFIVQIKKTKELKKCEYGKNQGKYVYSLETNFLYYVKAKVTESPAIYFIVDIDTPRIFFLYLSDNVLMNLDFEGKEHVSYAFSSLEILDDMDDFYNYLNGIADLRNHKYMYKTPEEISELQDVADYINNLFSGDLKEIKRLCFPNLWRFGIGYSTTSDFEIKGISNQGMGVEKEKFDKTNMFGLYPQYKGKNNQEISEFQFGDFGGIIDCGGMRSPLDYARDNIHNIIQSFCQNPPAEIVPSIALEEKVYKKAETILKIFEDSTEKIIVDELINKINVILSYIDMLFYQNHIDSEKEAKFKQIIHNILFMGHHNCLSIFNLFYISMIREDLNQYYNNNKGIRYNRQRVFDILTKDIIVFIKDIYELDTRGVKEIHCEWNTSFKVLHEDDISCVISIFDKWFSKMPEIYYELYERLFFTNNEYRFSCKIDYDIRKYDNCTDTEIKYYNRINKYNVKDPQITIRYKDINSLQITEEEKKNGIISKADSSLLTSIICNQHLYYDGIRSWLYQGICHKLGFDIKGLCIGGLPGISVF